MFVLGRKMVHERTDVLLLEKLLPYKVMVSLPKCYSTNFMSAPSPSFPNLHLSLSMFALGRRLVIGNFDVFLLENYDAFQAMVPVAVNRTTTML
jgi:hypothetical protein